MISKLPSNPENKKLAAAIADLKKNAGQKAVEFDDKLWMALLDEDDQSKDEH